MKQYLPPPPVGSTVIHVDEHCIVADKPTGLLSVPGRGPGKEDCLAARVQAEFADALIVHRLDMDTSGLMVCAKDDEMQRALQDLIRLRVLDRRYLVLVHGYVAPETGTITTGIARSTRDRLRMAVSDDPGAREAITTFTTLERFEAGRRDEGYSLLECHLYTGRTHQIRVHMRHISHQVVGDQLYGRGDDRQNLGLDRQFLHSWHIRFDHPASGKTIELADCLPPDLSGVLESIQERSMGRTEAGSVICPQILVSGPTDGTIAEG